MTPMNFSRSFSFFVRDCAFSTIATGYKAQTLPEFRDLLRTVSSESIYYHFWHQVMETGLPPGSFYNDFSHWAHYYLHDDFLAERLTWINPTQYHDLELLRKDMLRIVEQRLNEKEEIFIASPFYFVTSKMVVFNTKFQLGNPKEFVKFIDKFSLSSIFYHFIDARSRQPTFQNDFSIWLQAYGDEYLPLINTLDEIDPYFISLADLKSKLNAVFNDFFLKRFSDE